MSSYFLTQPTDDELEKPQEDNDNFIKAPTKVSNQLNSKRKPVKLEPIKKNTDPKRKPVRFDDSNLQFEPFKSNI